MLQKNGQTVAILVRHDKLLVAANNHAPYYVSDWPSTITALQKGGQLAGIQRIILVGGTPYGQVQIFGNTLMAQRLERIAKIPVKPVAVNVALATYHRHYMNPRGGNRQFAVMVITDDVQNGGGQLDYYPANPLEPCMSFDPTVFRRNKLLCQQGNLIGLYVANWLCSRPHVDILVWFAHECRLDTITLNDPAFTAQLKNFGDLRALMPRITPYHSPREVLLGALLTV